MYILPKCRDNQTWTFYLLDINSLKSGVSIGAGGAIVHLSNTADEFEEMLLKTKSVVGALLQTSDTVVINGSFNAISDINPVIKPNLRFTADTLVLDGCQTQFTAPVHKLWVVGVLLQIYGKTWSPENLLRQFQISFLKYSLIYGSPLIHSFLDGCQMQFTAPVHKL